MPEVRHAIRANIFLVGAQELVTIDSPSSEKPNLGSIAVCSEAIRAVLGKSAAEFARRDERVRELLREAATEGFKLRVRNDAHTYDLLSGLLKKLADVCHAPKHERQKGEVVFKCINRKLLNGFSGCEI